MFVRTTLAVLFLTASLAVAQITVSQENLPGFGFAHSSGALSSATFDVGLAGADRSWDFSGITLGELTTTTVLQPAGTPFSADYPAATHAMHTVATDGESYAYTQITGSAYSLLGIAIPMMDSALCYDAGALQMPLPLVYETDWTCLTRWTQSVEGYDIITQDSAVCTVDAWGTVTTPYGSWPVLRCLWHHYRSMVVMGMPVPQGEQLEYIWVNTQGLPIVSVKSTLGVTDLDFTTGSLCMVGNVLAAEPSRGPLAVSFAVGQNYPNPFNPTTTLPVALTQTARVELTIYDETGREVATRHYELPAGQHRLPIDGSGWATGTYFARLSAGDMQQTTKLLLVK